MAYSGPDLHHSTIQCSAAPSQPGNAMRKLVPIMPVELERGRTCPGEIQGSGQGQRNPQKQHIQALFFLGLNLFEKIRGFKGKNQGFFKGFLKVFLGLFRAFYGFLGHCLKHARSP